MEIHGAILVYVLLRHPVERSAVALRLVLDSTVLLNRVMGSVIAVLDSLAPHSLGIASCRDYFTSYLELASAIEVIVPMRLHLDRLMILNIRLRWLMKYQRLERKQILLIIGLTLA